VPKASEKKKIAQDANSQISDLSTCKRFQFRKIKQSSMGCRFAWFDQLATFTGRKHSLRAIVMQEKTLMLAARSIA